MLDCRPEIASKLTAATVMLQDVVELIESMPLLAGTETSNEALQVLHFAKLAFVEGFLSVSKLQAHARLDKPISSGQSAAEFIADNSVIYEKEVN